VMLQPSTKLGSPALAGQNGSPEIPRVSPENVTPMLLGMLVCAVKPGLKFVQRLASHGFVGALVDEEELHAATAKRSARVQRTLQRLYLCAVQLSVDFWVAPLRLSVFVISCLWMNEGEWNWLQWSRLWFGLFIGW
jgi:hypothetical protein